MSATPAARLIKFLNADRTSAHRGSGVWVPGEWRSVEGPLVPCQNGIHLCRPQDVLRWIAPAAWEPEAEGEQLVAEDKVVVRRARIVRQLACNETTLRCFAADCAERALQRAKVKDARCWAAVRAARQYAFGLIGGTELDTAGAAWDAAWDAAWAASGAAAWAARAASRAASGAAAWAARAASRAAGDAAWAAWAAGDAAWAAWAAGDAARAAGDAAWAAWAAGDAAWAAWAAGAAAWAAGDAAWAARAAWAAGAAARAAAWAAGDAAWAARAAGDAGAAAWAAWAAGDAAGDTGAAERQWQAHRLLAYFDEQVDLTAIRERVT